MTTYTLISALPGDCPVGVDIASPESPVDYRDLPDAAKTWAAAQGYGPDNPDELLYITKGRADQGRAPTLVIDF